MDKHAPFNSFLAFLRYERKWWLIPLIIVLLLVAVLVLLADRPQLAPFVYAPS